ncbi:MAG TPA: hypothetical protein VLJ58_17035 [Ramlibacter sp.]|nr:hypothetical protein [Ramlibacter sp.]
MQALRNAPFLARLVLAWFALWLGVAAASPLVSPQSLELICAGAGGSKVLVKDADGKPAASLHKMDCPLCAALDVPPPVRADLGSIPPQAHAVQPIPAARIAALTAAPLPARGPPAVLSFFA